MTYPFPYDSELPTKREAAAAFIRDIHKKLIGVYDREVLGAYDLGKDCAHMLHNADLVNETHRSIVDALGAGASPEGIGTALIVGAREPERHEARMYAARSFLLNSLGCQESYAADDRASELRKNIAAFLVIASYRILTEMVECAHALGTKENAA